MKHLRKHEIIRSHHGLVPCRYWHCDNQAKIIGTPHVVKLSGHTYEGLLYGNVRLHNKYGDPNTLTFFRHEQLTPLWKRNP